MSPGIRFALRFITQARSAIEVSWANSEIERSHMLLTASKPTTDSNHEIAAPGISWEGILCRCRLGDREAQRELYDRSQQSVFRLVARIVGRNEADDVAQQVFLNVFRSLDQFYFQSAFETWVYRIAVNESLQHLRRQRRWRCSSLTGDVMDREPDPERRLDHKELMEQALAQLEPELRSLFLLREVEELSYAEIAEALQIPEGTVASRMNRARRLLKERLVALGWEA